jgi:hypothetical protein
MSMTRTALVLGLAAAMAVPAIASPTSALANCHDRKVGGTVLGAVAGGFAGNALAHGGGRAGGTVLGALAGGVIGHEIARSGCHTYAYHRASYRHRREYAANDVRYSRGYGAPRCHYETRSYYDARGRLVYAPTQVCD